MQGLSLATPHCMAKSLQRGLFFSYKSIPEWAPTLVKGALVHVYQKVFVTRQALSGLHPCHIICCRQEVQWLLKQDVYLLRLGN